MWRAPARAVVALLALAHPAIAAPSYICVGELSTGFKWSGSSWAITNFKADASKFIVKPTSTPDDRKSRAYEVWVIGEKFKAYSCTQSSINDHWMHILCGGLGMGLVLNPGALRFQETYGIGFVDGMDIPGNTPNLTIGKCSVLDGAE